MERGRPGSTDGLREREERREREGVAVVVLVCLLSSASSFL